VAWLAELFPDPKQREKVLGFTQAFSSIGGLMVSGRLLPGGHIRSSFPAILGGHQAWRYTLLSGLIPAIPLILVRPFLPESPVWQEKKAKGTLKRPSFRRFVPGRHSARQHGSPLYVRVAASARRSARSSIFRASFPVCPRWRILAAAAQEQAVSKGTVHAGNGLPHGPRHPGDLWR
jgi:hypothetical protein